MDDKQAMHAMSIDDAYHVERARLLADLPASLNW